MHRLNVEIFLMDLHTFRTMKVPVFESLGFSLSEKRTRQPYELMCTVFCSVKRGIF